MSPSPKPVLTLLVDSGSSETDRNTRNATIEVQGLILGNNAIDVSKLTTANTSIDLNQELAQENQTLTAPPGTLIAYGKKGYSEWSFRVVPESGQLAINDSTFGNPLFGVAKAAYVATSSLAPAAAANNSWQFSIDDGQTWSAPIPVAAINRFEVADGSYAEGQVRVRQTVVTPPAPAAATGNLIQNGSFESGWSGSKWTGLSTLPGWSAVDRFEIWGPSMTRASDGNYLLEIDYSYAHDAITQTVKTVAGGTYQLEFDLKSRGGGSESVEVFWRGSLLTTVATSNRSSWTPFSLNVTGSGGSDALTFREPANENNNLGALIDNVRLNAVALPQTPPEDNTKIYESDTLFPAFQVDRRGPLVTLEAPGGADQIVSSNTLDRTVSGKAEPGQTVALVTSLTRSERFDSGSLPSWLKLDIPNLSIANIQLDDANGELDFSATGGRTNLWNDRDNAPFAWAARPNVSLNETWFIETKVRVDSRFQGETIAGITFSNGRDGDFQYGAPSFYLDAWHQQGTHVSLQGLGNNNPFATASGSTTVIGEAASTMLRVEITEKGTNDDYRFFYRPSEGESWIPLGDVYSYGIDNSRAALFYKTGGAKQGAASFDDVRVGTLSEVSLATGINVDANGNFSHLLSDEQLNLLGQGSEKTLVAVQQDLAGNVGRSQEVSFAVDTEIPPVRILSIGGGDGKVSSELKETGKGPLQLQLDQYTGYWSSKLSDLQNYVATFNPESDQKRYSVTTDAIDFTDDQGGFAGELNFDKRWPAAEALNAWGTGGINNHFFAKISGEFFVDEASKYRFRTFNDDGVFLLINDQLVISDPTLHPERIFTGDIELDTGNHQLELFFFENGGEASLEFSVSRFDPATGKWGPYSLVGKNSNFQARSVLEIDNLIEGEASPGSQVTLWLGDQQLGSSLADVSGRFRYAMSNENLALLAEAPSDLAVTATVMDAAGNIGRSSPMEVALGDTTPVVTLVSVGGSDSLVSSSNADTLVVGNGVANLPTLIYSGERLLGQVNADDNGLFAYTLTPENLEALGQGNNKTILAKQTRPSGVQGSSDAFSFNVDTIAPQIAIDSVGFGDGRVSLNAVELGQGPVRFTVDQFTGYRSNKLADLQTYVASYDPASSSNLYSVSTDVIDFTDDQGGFAGELPYDKRWPAAEALNAWGTGGINNNFFTHIHTSFYVAQAGNYRFRTYNDDGVFLLIDGDIVINDSGIHPEQVFTGDINLDIGNHELELYFFEYSGEASLEFSVSQFDATTSSWGPYQLVGQAPSLRAQSIRRADNLIEGRAEPGLVVQLLLGDVELARVTADSFGRFTYALTSSDLSLIASQNPPGQLVAVQLDAAGNRGVSDPVQVSAKLNPPAVSFTEIGGSDSVISSQVGDSIIRGLAEAGLPVQLLFNGEVLAVTSPVSEDGQFSHVLSAKQLEQLGQGGPVQITGRQQDDYGNVGSQLSPSFSVDTLAPVLTLPLSGQLQALGGVDGVVSTQNGDSLIAGQAEPDREVLIHFNGLILASLQSGPSGSFNYQLTEADITLIGQGAGKSLELSQMDAAGNMGTASLYFDLDTVAPEAPNILDVAGDRVISGIPKDTAISGKAEPGSLVSLFVSGSLLTTVTANRRGQFSYSLSDDDLANLGQGTFSVEAQISDAAGNVARSAAYSFRIDTLAPEIPTILSVGGEDNIISTRGSGSVTSTVDNIVSGIAEAASMVEIYSGTKLLGTATAAADGRFVYALSAPNVASIGQGERKAIKVKSIDAAGNNSEYTLPFRFAVDTVPPQAPRIREIGGKDGILTTLEGDNQISGRTEANAMIELSVLNGTLPLFSPQQLVADRNGAWSYVFSTDQLATLQAATTAGNALQIQLVTQDAAGNEGVSIGVAPVVDLQAPLISLSMVGGADGVVSSTRGDNIIQGFAEPNSTVSILSGRTRLGEARTGVDGSFAYGLTRSNIATIGQGVDRLVEVSQVDRAGNSTSVATPAFAIDTIAPSKAVIRSLGGRDRIVTTQAGDHAVIGTAEAGEIIDLQFVSGPNRITLGTLEVPEDGAFSYVLTPENLDVIRQGVGKQLVVSSQDAAGNRSESQPFRFSVQALWSLGTSSADILPLHSDVDAITGFAGADTFKLHSLASGRVGRGQSPTFDHLTDFQIGIDLIDAPTSVSAEDMRNLGTIQALSTTHLGRLLTPADFPAFGAAVFTYQDASAGERTFLALNDRRAGFSSRTDAILEITGYSGSLSNLAVI